ncbi:MAG: dihydrofolate reductase family protein [Ignavibacteriales bacterium]|nr:dihydrofolate reductase family protein [Ignavibacteriales bacterium]MBK7981193.1 dihydrofolate reductase family protein [Ignavibacteriota bacterium]
MSRKLKLQMQTSLDGFVAAGPNDDQTWVTWAWDEIKEDVLGLLDDCDTHIIGRKLAVDYIPYWQDVFTKPDDPMFEVAKRMAAIRKIVFSNSIKKSPWENIEVVNGNLNDEVIKLKKQNGKDIFAVGGTSFVSSLIAENLIDEFYFYVNPVALGKGDPVFNKIQSHKHLKLIKSKMFNCGINLFVYELKKGCQN